MNSIEAKPYRRFQVALSFSGVERPYIAEVAEHLCEHFGKEKVFYDGHYQDELARIGLSNYLQDIYHNDTDLIAIFFSESYNDARWCGLEWRSVNDLISERPEIIVPVNMGTKILPPGLFNTDGYLKGFELDPLTLSGYIIKRYQREYEKLPDVELGSGAGVLLPVQDKLNISGLLNSSSTSAAYVLFISAERLASLFQQVDVDVLLSMTAGKRSYLPFGIPSSYGRNTSNNQTLIHQLATVLTYLEKNAKIGDLNNIIESKGRLDRDWYKVKAEFIAAPWDQEKPTIVLTTKIGGYMLELNCTKRYFAGIIEERGKLFPTSMSSILFEGNSQVHLNGLVRIGAFDKASGRFQGSALCLILEPLDLQL